MADITSEAIKAVIGGLHTERRSLVNLCLALTDRLRKPEEGTHPDSVTVGLSELLADLLSDYTEIDAAERCLLGRVGPA